MRWSHIPTTLLCTSQCIRTCNCRRLYIIHGVTVSLSAQPRLRAQDLRHQACQRLLIASTACPTSEPCHNVNVTNNLFNRDMCTPDGSSCLSEASSHPHGLQAHFDAFAAVRLVHPPLKGFFSDSEQRDGFITVCCIQQDSASLLHPPRHGDLAPVQEDMDNSCIFGHIACV